MTLCFCLLAALPGCDRRRTESENIRAPVRAGDSPATRIAAMEEGIKEKQWTLPSQAKALVRELREHRTTLQGDAAALDRMIARLENWCAKSETRNADTDADRDELRTILRDLRTELQRLEPPATDAADPSAEE